MLYLFRVAILVLINTQFQHYIRRPGGGVFVYHLRFFAYISNRRQVIADST